MRFRTFKLLAGVALALLQIELSTPAWAAVDLFIWQATPSSPRMILPRLDQETPEEALHRYLRDFAQNPDLSRFLPPSGVPEARGAFAQLEGPTSKVKTALISNWVADLFPHGERILRNTKTFSEAGADVYVISPAADLGLSPAAAEQFRDLVATKFNLLVSMGGSDLHHDLSGSEAPAPSTQQISWVMDTAEYKLVETFKRMGRGVFLGICRGHQLGALIDGHQLYSDLSEIPGVDRREHFNPAGQVAADILVWHGIEIHDDSLLGRFVRGLGFDRFQTGNHQAVRVNPDANSVEVAQDRGVNEALISRNGLGISLQFHIDFPESISGDASYSRKGLAVLRRVVAYARLVRQIQSKPGFQCGLFLSPVSK